MFSRRPSMLAVMIEFPIPSVTGDDPSDIFGFGHHFSPANTFSSPTYRVRSRQAAAAAAEAPMAAAAAGLLRSGRWPRARDV